jgi:hypothetical protein
VGGVVHLQHQLCRRIVGLQVRAHGGLLLPPEREDARAGALCAPAVMIPAAAGAGSVTKSFPLPLTLQRLQKGSRRVRRSTRSVSEPSHRFSVCSARTGQGPGSVAAGVFPRANLPPELFAAVCAALGELAKSDPEEDVRTFAEQSLSRLTHQPATQESKKQLAP